MKDTDLDILAGEINAFVTEKTDPLEKGLADVVELVDELIQQPSPVEGKDGADGAVGPKGDQGDQGEQGLTGEKGEQGEQGQKASRANPESKAPKASKAKPARKAKPESKAPKAKSAPKAKTEPKVKLAPKVKKAPKASVLKSMYGKIESTVKGTWSSITSVSISALRKIQRKTQTTKIGRE